MSERKASVQRVTSETDITISVDLDGTGSGSIDSGLAFLDHMLTSLARHSGVDVSLNCKGDLRVDDHHTVEDVALALGSALDQALGERRGIVRFGYAYAPLDESLARVVIDLSGRPCSVVSLDLVRESIGAVATENLAHFFRSLATTLRASVHVDVLRGDNDHHKAEAAFKAFALALRAAVGRTGDSDVPSTKGVL